MGQLDEAGFAAAIAGCAGCGGTGFEITTYIDRQVSVMLGDPNDDGRWTYDGEKLIDGVSRITCLGCRRVGFSSDACPRCHAPGGLALAAAPSRLAVPPRCPACRGTELTVIGMAPAMVRTTAGTRPPPPTPSALLGDDGFHVMAMACDDCEWATVTDPCPLCGAPAPLRERP